MKTIYTLLLFLGFGMLVQAQDSKVVVLYTEQGDQKQVFNIDKASNTLVLTEKDKTEQDGLFDAFIIKPSIEHPGAVYLIAAQENQMFLKRNGDTLEFKDIQEETSAVDRDDYEWEIQYSGFPWITISDPAKPRSVIYKEGNTLRVQEVAIADWVLANNNDPKGEPFRYKIKNITNTF
ncbi:hypothetical protein D1818_17640 [Aquimarina sp. BL5]|uniref:hypothetical protein n=1 Tax=Aquimarina sp. BL5 TaxID=1714860 RepID=UPI000E4F4EEE|nr:hypothetical protein [Aquimarina sp. BL5]AXT52565.1 hypothetical protein D1818_17640 [Aquimarina sp. BL5]RKN11249.1 hypothetical protein D7036_01155 [Aquimarina sp. BL5]